MSVRVPAGEMRHVINVMQHKIEQSSTAYDTYGMVSASSTAWKRIAQIRGKIEELSGVKDSVASQQFPVASHMVTIDYLSILASTGGTRRALEFNSRMMFIRTVMNPDQENRQLQLIVSESL